MFEIFYIVNIKNLLKRRAYFSDVYFTKSVGFGCINNLQFDGYFIFILTFILNFKLRQIMDNFNVIILLHFYRLLFLYPN